MIFERIFKFDSQVLYSKRDDVRESSDLPVMLKKHARNQLQACPEEVASRLEWILIYIDDFCLI